MQEMKLLIFLKKGLLHLKVMYLKHKTERNQKKKIFLNILAMNQKVLAMICLKNILVLQYLLFWPKNYMKQKIKTKIMTQ